MDDRRNDATASSSVSGDLGGSDPEVARAVRDAVAQYRSGALPRQGDPETVYGRAYVITWIDCALAKRFGTGS